MRNLQIAEVLLGDKWNLAERSHPTSPGLLRYRVPILGPDGVEGYPNVLRILWAYAEEESGQMPSADDSAAMGRFEELLCDTLQVMGTPILQWS